MSLTIPKGITTQPVGKVIIEPWVKVPSNMAVASPAKQLASKLGVPPIIGVPVLAVTVAGLLGGDQARDSQLKKLGLEYDPNTGLSRPIREVNSGNRTTSELPPFNGGQVSGVMYRVNFTDLVSQGTGNTETRDLQGKIGVPYKEGGNWYLPYADGSLRLNRGGNSYYGLGRDVVGVRINSVIRLDGLPDVSIETPTSTSPSGGVNSDGNPEDFNRSQVKRILPPKLSSTIGWGNTKPIDGRAALGIGNISAGVGFAPNTAPKPPSPNKAPKNPVTTPTKPKETEKPKTPTPNPLIPQPSELTKANVKLTEIGAILGTIAFNQGTISNNINDIKQNTSTQNLENAAQTGSCRALNSSPCTNKLKNEIQEPIIAKQDALGKALLGTNQAAQDGVLLGMVAKLNQMQEFAGKVYEASKLDKIYNFLTFFVTVHNAAMLSNSLITTLEDTLSQGLATFNIKDIEGNPINIQENVNKTTRQIIESVIGAQNYSTLSENWAKANNIFRAGANVLYNMRSLWDSAKSLQEMMGANLGQLMNSLRRDGVVSENAYPAKCENPLMINSGMDRLQNLESAASHLNQITSTTYGITQTVAQLKDDKDNFDKALKEQPKKKGIENDAEKNALAASKTVSPSPAITTENLVKPD